MAEPIYIKVDGHQGVLTPGTLLNTIKYFWDFLRDLDSAITGDPMGTVYWQIEHLSKGSPAVIAFQGQSRLAQRDYISEIEDECIEGVNAINLMGERHRNYSDAAINKVLRLARLHTTRNPRDRVDEIIIGTDDRKVEVGKITIERIDELRSARYYSQGSVVGNLDSITVHLGNEFRVWEELLGRPVTCRFTKEKLEEVKKVLGKRVLVFGQVQANDKGQPTSINVEGIELYPEDSELPSIEEMSGLVDNLTGGLSLADYIEEIRNG